MRVSVCFVTVRDLQTYLQERLIALYQEQGFWLFQAQKISLSDQKAPIWSKV